MHDPLPPIADDDCPQYVVPRTDYRTGLIHALRHVLEHLSGQHRFFLGGADMAMPAHPCVPVPDIEALLAHVEEHGELPIARGAKETE
jgi:hypothetical protein